MIGYVMVCFGACGAVSAFFFGNLQKYVPRASIICVGKFPTQWRIQVLPVGEGGVPTAERHQPTIWPLFPENWAITRLGYSSLGSAHTEALVIALALAGIAKNGYSTHFLYRYH